MIIQFHRIVFQLTISLINTLSSTETRKFEHDLRSSTTMFREQRASYTRELLARAAHVSVRHEQHARVYKRLRDSGISYTRGLIARLRTISNNRNA